MTRRKNLNTMRTSAGTLEAETRKYCVKNSDERTKAKNGAPTESVCAVSPIDAGFSGSRVGGMTTAGDTEGLPGPEQVL